MAGGFTPSPDFQRKMRGVVRLTYAIKVSGVLSHIQSSAAVVLTILSSIELLSICLPRRLPRQLLVLSAALLSRRLVVEFPRLLTRRSPG
jgi:hypothetical protein